MSGSTDDIKGRIKEAAGDLTNDDDLKREGKADQAGAKDCHASVGLEVAPKPPVVGQPVDAVHAIGRAAPELQAYWFAAYREHQAVVWQWAKPVIVQPDDP